MVDIEKEYNDFKLYIMNTCGEGCNLSINQTNTGITINYSFKHGKLNFAWEAWLFRAKLEKGVDCFPEHTDAMCNSLAS